LHRCSHAAVVQEKQVVAQFEKRKRATSASAAGKQQVLPLRRAQGQDDNSLFGQETALVAEHLLALLGILEFFARRARQRKLQHLVDVLHVVGG